MPVLKVDPRTNLPTGELISAQPKKSRKTRQKKVLTFTSDENRVDPLNSPNREPVIEELIPELNKIIDEFEQKLQKWTKEFNVQVPTDGSLTPKEIKYISSVTISNGSEDAFNLNKPTGVCKLDFGKINLHIYVDRIFLNPNDVKFLLKFPEKAKKIINNLLEQMVDNLCKTKNIESTKKYFAKNFASLKRPGIETYCSAYQDELIEIRMFSDATENLED